MSDFLPLLIELGTEELPPKALPELAQALFDGVTKGLATRHIKFETADGFADARPMYTPRRLVVLLPKVATQQPTQYSEVLGPYTNIALDANGLPTPALLGFAQKNGMTVEQLGRTTDAKGARFVARITREGAPTASLIAEIVAEAVKGLPIPKPMRWSDHDISFVRPVHLPVMLLGRDVCDGHVLGLEAYGRSRRPPPRPPRDWLTQATPRPRLHSDKNPKPNTRNQRPNRSVKIVTSVFKHLLKTLGRRERRHDGEAKPGHNARSRCRRDPR